VPEPEWDKSMLRMSEPEGQFLIETTAQWPGEMTEAIAAAIDSSVY